MRILSLSFLLIFFVSCAKLDYSVEDCSNCDLWGDDNRQEAYEVIDANIQKAIQATGVLRFLSDPVVDENDEVFLTFKQTLRDEYEVDGKKFCSDVRFVDQPRLKSPCSGFLIAPDLFATTAHCIRDEITNNEDKSISCDDVHVAFGYEIQSDGSFPTAVPKANFYSCESVVILDPESAPFRHTEDFALIRLDEPVHNRPFIDAIRWEKPTPGTEILNIGFPDGLPAKIASGSVVENHYTDEYLEANRTYEWAPESELEKIDQFFSDKIFSNDITFQGLSLIHI